MKGGGLPRLRKLHLQDDTIDIINADMTFGMLSGCPALKIVESSSPPRLKGEAIVVHDTYIHPSTEELVALPVSRRVSSVLKKSRTLISRVYDVVYF